jgi:HD superfamily phosphohydrolase
VNKHKIINDPVHGFISISYPEILKLVDHPLFQRLRHISQMGLSYLVYPGAHHTRLQHAIGAMHLMGRAVDVLRSKGVDITEEEKKAAMSAILLHDVGHGPFSHALEYAIIHNINHEDISMAIMQKLNREAGGGLSLAIDIFQGNYHKKFLHQLISSQLDVDRMDYLQRDSFFTGVIEGRINSGRIIEMLSVAGRHLTVEEKGIYSIEKFIVSRRFMYWQVYFHKTSLMFEKLLEQTLRRAKDLYLSGRELYLDGDLAYFFASGDLKPDDLTLDTFARLTDADILFHLKKWTTHSDTVLRLLSKSIIERKTFSIDIRPVNIDAGFREKIKEKTRRSLKVEEKELSYLVLEGQISNTAYNPEKHPIMIQMKNGRIMEFSDTTDHSYIRALSHKVRKFYLIYPKIV